MSSEGQWWSAATARSPAAGPWAPQRRWLDGRAFVDVVASGFVDRRLVEVDNRVTVGTPVHVDPHLAELALLSILATSSRAGGAGARATISVEGGALRVALWGGESGVPLPRAEIASAMVEDTGIGPVKALGTPQRSLVSAGTGLDDPLPPGAADARGAPAWEVAYLVADAVARLHGGAIELGAGGRLEAWLPIEGSAPPPAPPLAPRRSELAALRARSERAAAVSERAGRRLIAAEPLALVVEDDPATRELLEDCLADEFGVAFAHDGVAGLAAAAVWDPDVVLVDVAMPGLGGESLVRILRSRPPLAHLPFVVLTGARNPERVVRMLDNGAQDFIAKPFIVPELVARVRNVVAAKRARDLLADSVGRQESDILLMARDVRAQQRALEENAVLLERARHEAVRASEAKSVFLRMMSHELKTPVTAMALHTRALARADPVARSAELGGRIVRVRRSLSRLMLLVDTMLEWARADASAPRLQLATIDLEDLLEMVLEEHESLADEKGIDLRLVPQSSPPEPAFHDPRVVRLLVTNLVARAIQLTEDGAVEVRIESSLEGARIAVRDDGPRMADSALRSEIDPLGTPVDLDVVAGAGSGFGLLVVRDIARAVGCELTLEPSPSLAEVAESRGNVSVLLVPRRSERR